MWTRLQECPHQVVRLARTTASVCSSQKKHCLYRSHCSISNQKCPNKWQECFGQIQSFWDINVAKETLWIDLTCCGPYAEKGRLSHRGHWLRWLTPAFLRNLECWGLAWTWCTGAGKTLSRACAHSSSNKLKVKAKVGWTRRIKSRGHVSFQPLHSWKSRKGLCWSCFGERMLHLSRRATWSLQLLWTHLDGKHGSRSDWKILAALDKNMARKPTCLVAVS